MARTKKDMYGNFKKTYYIALLGSRINDDGKVVEHTIKYVTDVSYYPKEARWEADKPAMRFDSYESAQNVALGLLCNGYGAVIVQSLATDDGDVMETALNNIKEEQ